MAKRFHCFLRPSPSFFCAITLAAFLLLSVYSNRVTAFSEDNIAAALLYNIFEHVEWPDERPNQPFVVLTYGVDSHFNRLLERQLPELDVRGMPIEVRKVISKDALSKWMRADDVNNQSFTLGAAQEEAKLESISARVLLVGENKNSELSNLATLLRRSGILLLSQESSNKRDIMINLRRQSKVISFEINRSNIIYEGLAISKEILLLGGSELDVAILYRETEDQLQKSRRAFEALERTIAKQMEQKAEATEEIKTLTEKIHQQQSMLEEQYSTIRTQKETLLNNSRQLDQSNKQLLELRTELTKTNEQLEQSRSELKKNEVALENSRVELERDSIARKSLLSRIEENASVLEHQEERISSQASLISAQKTTLGEQSKTIRYQRAFILFVGVIALLVMLLIYLILRGYREKKRVADQLAHKNKRINDTLKALKKTQQQLIESEKFASLGELVAGVAHEINTPIGIAVTLTSDLQDRLSAIEAELNKQTLTEKSLRQFCDGVQVRYDILFKNIHRAADLVKSFKEVAVDQSSDNRRTFNLKSYVDECLNSLSSKINRTEHRVIVDCPDSLEINSYPGALFQVISILIINSLEHGFRGVDSGYMQLAIKVVNGSENNETEEGDGAQLHLSYKDSGVGASDDVIKKIFNPFFTTERSNGGSGLGTHIMYNIVTQLLQGQIRCTRSDINGLQFDICFPLTLGGKQIS